ncbi:DUF6333 family protein [Streptomyces sp. NPDC053493]|uniref:DUF6333 family protein n=1 Tax=Streptomyces sp. NPDC053493 TaxID=3365705 RepID=UPI0037D4270C
MTDSTPVDKWGTYELTLLFPPFTPTGPTLSDAPAPPNDPVRARRVAESLGTVAEVVEELPSRALDDLPSPGTRDDLDVVAVGCWGGLVLVVDPALASDAVVSSMAEEIGRQRALHPDARITGAVFLDAGQEFSEYLVDLPGGPALRVGGWDDEEEWARHGDPEEILRTLDVDPAGHGEDLDLDEDPRFVDWDAFLALALGPQVTDGDRSRLRPSLFRVRRSERGAAALADVWFG